MHTVETKLEFDNEIIGVLGAPNSGKTTLFNWITGSRYKCVNYPGSTVDYCLGKSLNQYGDESLFFMDTPGTYSLFPQSSDEMVTHKALFQPQGYPQIQKLIVVVDATQLSHQLYLAKQAIEAGFQIVIALTMSDLIKKDHLIIHSQELSKEFGCPVIEIDGTLGGGIKQLIEAVKTIKIADTKPTTLAQWTNEKIDFELKKIGFLSQKIIQKKPLSVFAKTLKIDKVLLHPFFGYVIFFLAMAFLFTSIFWAATPFMDLIDTGFVSLGEKAQDLLGKNLFSDLLSNGIIASFAAIFVFVPQIFILFLGIGALEDSGYLARASTLVDKPFSKIGMNGRSFVPLLSGFACAVPAIMATRTIGNLRERLITMFIIPLMSCSARLPVFALLLSFLFFNKPAWYAGLTLTFLYFFSLVVGVIAAAILNSILKVEHSSSFFMQLPLYRLPKMRVLFKNAYNRTLSYIKRAGPVIFVLALIIWTLSTFPNYKLEDASQKLQTSYLGQTGQVIEPIFEPMGVDWRAGVGLITAFAAREVFVSSLAVMYNVGEDATDVQNGLIEKMKEATFSDGSKVFTLASVVSLIIFFVIALQCLSTVAVSLQEMGSWKWALLQLISFNIVAYTLAVLSFQVLS